MTGPKNKTSLWLIRIVAICAVFGLLAYTGGQLAAQDKKNWAVPNAAREVKNPVPATPENLKAAADLFKNNCTICHGEKGKGDGIGAGSDTPPANFTDAKLMSSETDGALFWKLSEGRGPMPPWKDSLSEIQRWQLVNYLRTLKNGADSKDANPTKNDNPSKQNEPTKDDDPINNN